MARIDPVAERARLASLYSSMSDLELEKVGRNPSDLTPWASEALAAEMRKRGMECPPASLAEEFLKQKGKRLKVVGTYEDQRDAIATQAELVAAGFETFLATDPHHPSGDEQAGALLLVRDTDYEAAAQVLLEKEALAAVDEDAGQLADDQLPSQPVVLRVYRDITAAMVDKATLDAAGIKCFLYDDNLVRLDWFISNAVDGVRLVVAEDNAPEAAHILASAVPIADDEPAGS